MSGALAVPALSRLSVRDAFQGLSYLQYPALLVALGYAARSGWSVAAVKATGWSPVYDDWNYLLLYAGIGIGLSSLQDPTRTQNEMSRRVWRDPRKGRWMLVLLGIYALGAMLVGLVGAYMAASTVVNQLSLGLVAFGLGMVGVLKTAIEMREHHRLDKQPASSPEGSHA
ncbi:hypothetical protein [Lysobacter solisilvae (ex Woo and Kim 2020)]|uniref:Uncharacterized protein n=1 Tax=Agrilutibacter terrestris TaxID=2865112 RepID=A0A7H0FV04_9GAMM|nr:hypothetical protein [Lysobacter terrestris]QNP39870.1 hypothetical protein H8B22_10165 [Lysobacter terrestris]